MAYVDVEQLLEKTGGSVYKLVILASRRALEIAEGQPKLSSVDAGMKPSTIALHEILEGKVGVGKIKE